MARVNRDAVITFACSVNCYWPEETDIEGHYNAEGKFEIHGSEDQLECSSCGGEMIPLDEDIEVMEI